MEHSGVRVSRDLPALHCPWRALQRHAGIHAGRGCLHDSGDSLLDRHVLVETSPLTNIALAPRIANFASQSPYMKFCRFVVLDNSKTQPAIPVFGIIEDDKVIEISGPPWQQWSRTPHTRPLSDVR